VFLGVSVLNSEGKVILSRVRNPHALETLNNVLAAIEHVLGETEILTLTNTVVWHMRAKCGGSVMFFFDTYFPEETEKIIESTLRHEIAPLMKAEKISKIIDYINIHFPQLLEKIKKIELENLLNKLKELKKEYLLGWVLHCALLHRYDRKLKDEKLMTLLYSIVRNFVIDAAYPGPGLEVMEGDKKDILEKDVVSERLAKLILEKKYQEVESFIEWALQLTDVVVRVSRGLLPEKALAVMLQTGSPIVDDTGIERRDAMGLVISMAYSRHGIAPKIALEIVETDPDIKNWLEKL